MSEDARLKQAVSTILVGLRDDYGVSRNQLAQVLEFNPNSLYFIEKGGYRKVGKDKKFVQHLPSIPTLLKIASAYRISPITLFNSILEELGDGIKEYSSETHISK